MMVKTAERQPRREGTDPKTESLLRLPARTRAPAFDSSVWGGRFPKNRYFPFYLANGRDAALINLSGSGDGHWERPPYSADVLSKLHAIGWYKADRRLLRPDCGVYGPLICLGEFTSCPRLHADYVVPRDVRQYFDPKTATLTTFYRQRDNRSDQLLEVRIESYLCANSVLVQEIEVLQAPPCGVGYAFSLSSASPGYQNHMRPVTVPDTCRLELSRNGEEVTMTSTWPGLEAVGFSVIGGVPVERTTPRSLPAMNYEEMEQTTSPLPVGARFWRAVGFFDTREGDDPAAVCADILQDIQENGIRPMRERHLLEWEEYFSQCHVQLPDPAAQHLHELSRYLLKANHHPRGYQPVGLLPYQWQGVMFWDATFAQEAFLQCGNLGEARAIGNQIHSLLPEGRELAAKLGNTGARMEWTNNLDTFTRYEPPTRQFHNNAVWARGFSLLGDYQGTPPSREDFTAIEDLLRFLIGEYENHGSARGHDFAFVGIDESSDDPKPYDTWTFSVLLKALDDYLALCRRHDHPPVFPSGLKQKLQAILDANVDDDGILQSFRGGRLPHWGSLVFDLFPDHPAAMPTLRRMAENYDPEQDLFNFHGLNRYAEKTFPWATHMVARSLAKIGRSEAMDFFLHSLNQVNYFGGFSERLYYHGEHYIEWFSTAHAALVLALNTMLATTVNGRLQLLGGLDPARWPTLSFDGLHAGDGWVVSLELRDGAVQACTVTNLRPEARELVLTIPPLKIRHTQLAENGPNVLTFSAS